MATVPRRFFSPLPASLAMGSCVGFLTHILRKTTTLHHEFLDHPMKNRAVKKPVLYVLEKILHGFWGGLLIEFQDNNATVRFHADTWILLGIRPYGVRHTQYSNNKHTNDFFQDFPPYFPIDEWTMPLAVKVLVHDANDAITSNDGTISVFSKRDIIIIFIVIINHNLMMACLRLIISKHEETLSLFVFFRLHYKLGCRAMICYP